MSHLRTQVNTKYNCEMYRLVFECVCVKYAIAFLFATFLLQPVAPVYANVLASEEVMPDEVTEAEKSETEEVSVEEVIRSRDSQSTIDDKEFVGEEEVESVERKIQEEVEVDTADSVSIFEIENYEANAETSNVTILASTSDNVKIKNNGEIHSTSSSEVIDSSFYETTASSTAVTNEDAASVTASSSEEYDDQTNVNNNTEDTVEVFVVNTEATSTQVASSTDEIVENEVGENEDEVGIESDSKIKSEIELDELIEEVGTSTDEVTQSTSTLKIPVLKNTLSAVTNNSNRHQFSINDCTSVGDGSFYCSTADEAPALYEDGVFTVPDEDGDMEIMVRVDGEEEFITDNKVDDAAPYYDAVSDRIVWHVLESNRYQIASYDFASGDTKILTDTSYNNMEPVAHGELTLWQAWIKNNWEIMIYDGVSTTQLTNNQTHDVAPHMRGGYILWQTQFEDGWRVAMYDVDTQNIKYLGEGDGAQVENPRLVLVYDSLSANGDVETVGYDLESGEVVPLSRIPTKLPEQIPEPEQTGETRALIQNKSQREDNEIVDFEFFTTGTSSSPNNASTTPISVDSATLDFSGTSTEQTVVTTPLVKLATSSDLVITPQVSDIEVNATTSISTEHIPDVIVPAISSSTIIVQE